MKNKKFVTAVLTPSYMHLAVFLVLPIVAGLLISFFQYNPLNSDSQFIGLANFQRLFQDELFIKSLKNTLFFVSVTVFLNIAIALTLAQFISKFKSNKVRSFFRMIFFLPCVAPMVASSVVWGKSIFPTTNGLFNIILRSIGLTEVNWLGDPSILMWSVILYTLWVDVGYNIILFSAGMDGIPGELYEAAELDGANEWQKFRYITLPLLKRTMVFVVLMTLISHFQMFAQFSVMILKNGPDNAGLVLTSYIYQNAFVYKDMGYASAISMALFVIILLVTLVQQRAQKVDWEY